METYTFVASWGKFTLTLEYVSIVARLPLFGDCNVLGITSKEEDERTLQLLTSALLNSKNQACQLC